MRARSAKPKHGRQPESEHGDEGTYDAFVLTLAALRSGSRGRNPCVLIRAIPTADTISATYPLLQGQKSQSLRADQGNSDHRKWSPRLMAPGESQSLRADQGNSDIYERREIHHKVERPSQSLRADQGNSDRYEGWRARTGHGGVAIPPC